MSIFNHLSARMESRLCVSINFDMLKMACVCVCVWLENVLVKNYLLPLLLAFMCARLKMVLHLQKNINRLNATHKAFAPHNKSHWNARFHITIISLHVHVHCATLCIYARWTVHISRAVVRSLPRTRISNKYRCTHIAHNFDGSDWYAIAFVMEKWISNQNNVANKPYTRSRRHITSAKYFEYIAIKSNK